MKIWLFYARFKVCFPHAWVLTKYEKDKKGNKVEVYTCAICGKTKRKKIK